MGVVRDLQSAVAGARGARRGSLIFTVRAGLVLAALVPPLAGLLLFARDGRRGYRLVRRCARAVVRLSGVRVTVDGLQHVPTGTHAMFVSNHSSLADAAILLAALPLDFRFVANHVFAGYPLLGAAIRAASYHIVDRGSWRSRAECGRSMVDALRAGQSLLVFPEGTTSNVDGLLPFRSGAFRAAVSSGASVVPIAITGTRDLLPPDRLWLAPVPVRIEVLPPVTPSSAGGREAVTALRETVAAAIRRRLDLQQ